MDQHALSDLIGEIYDAAVDPRQWRAFLEDLVRQIHPDGKALLLVDDIAARSDTITASANFDPHYLKLYSEVMEKLNPWPAMAERQSVGIPFTNEALLPRHQLVRTDFYNHWLRPQEVEGGPAVLIARDRGRAMVLTILHGGTPEESDIALTLFTRLVPNLQRAAQIHRQFRRMRFRQDAFEAAFNRLALGVVVLDGTGRIIFANRSGDAILRRADALAPDHDGGVRATARGDDVRLRRLIEDSLRTGLGRDGGSGGVMALHRADRVPVSALVAPLHLPAINGHKAAAILFISDPEENACPASTALAGLFTLTPAEARLLHRLAEGLSLKECAAEFSLSYATVRAQLASILRKTGCDRQTEVVRLALLSPAFLALPDGTD